MTCHTHSHTGTEYCAAAEEASFSGRTPGGSRTFSSGSHVFKSRIVTLHYDS